jgi:tubulin-specific chaperone E
VSDSGNRYQESLVAEIDPNSAREAFASVREIALDETLLGWESICHISNCFESMAILHASTNQLSRLPPLAATTLTETLTTLYLEYNDFTALSDIACLGQLTSLKNMHLKGNNISAITTDTVQGAPVFSKTLTHLDISYNKVSNWAFVDALPDSFPGLHSLRLAHNPVYEDPGFEKSSITAAAAGSAGPKTTVTEEAYMITVARLACLQTLNFSSVTPADRINAEMFYLSRIGRQLASVPESPEAEAAVTSQHRRYRELCELYDEPVVVRRKVVNPAFLEARLVNVAFRFCPSDRDGATESGVEAVERHAQIPKAFDIYAVKGIAGRLFGHEPLKLRLIWETGEWDPVAGLDDAGDSSDEDEYEDAAGGRQALDDACAAQGHAHRQPDSKTGRWIKREEELRDSPRQFGFCVDGLDVSIRVEPR